MAYAAMKIALLLIDAVLPMLFYIVAGGTAKLLKLVDSSAAAAMHRIVYFICFPCMMFASTYSCNLRRAFDIPLTLFLACALLITFMVITFTVPLFVKDRLRCGVLAQGLLRGNMAAFGLPLVLSLCASHESASISLSYSCIFPLVIILAISGLKWFQGEKQNLAHLLKNALYNPIAMGTLCGVVFNLLKVPMHSSITSAMENLGKMATPLAFMLLGASLSTFGSRKNRLVLMFYVPCKLLFIPMIWITIATGVFGFRNGRILAVMGVFAVPGAISSVSTAKTLGYDDVLLEEMVAYTTAFSIVTIVLWITILKLLHLC